MCVKRRFGRLGKWISGRQSGFLAGRAKRNLSNGAGFTLIELLVVIAVIALLLAILVPVLRSARNHARTVVCQSNLKQWGQILNLYTQDNEGFLPRSDLDVFLVTFRRPFDTDYNRIISSYAGISVEGITCCPMAKTAPGESAEIGTWSFGRGPDARQGEFRYGNTFEAWEIAGWGSPVRGSYGLNRHLFHHDVWIPFRNFGWPRGFNTTLVKGSVNIPAFLDATLYAGAPYSHDDPPRRELYDGGAGMRQFCVNRHNGYINGLFLDWSVRKIGLKELWTLRWEPQFNTAGEWTKAGGVHPKDWPKWMRRFKDY